MRPVVVVRTIDLASPPEQVWPLLADTDQSNRRTGGRPVVFRPIEPDSPTSARFVGETRAGGFALVYEELPFEWSEGRWFRLERRMRSGPLHAYAVTRTLEPFDSSDGEACAPGTIGARGTRVTVRVELVPRHSFLRPLAWLNARRFAMRIVALARAIDAHLREGAPSPYLGPASPVNDDALASSSQALAREGADAALVGRLATLLRDGPDAALARVRPFEVADGWGADRREVLRTMLRAVPAGMLEMRWSIVCPSCLTAAQTVRALDQIAETAHCQQCDITFELDLDRAVEATFLPHPSVRAVPEHPFCIGGPRRTPHVLAQANLDPGEGKDFVAPARPGRYRVFARGGAVAALEVGEEAPDSTLLLVDGGAVRPAHAQVRPGGVVRIESRCPDARHVKIEHLAFASAAATAHEVSTLSEFRALFTRDLLKRGTPVKVSRAAVLFSDLTGSTSLYADMGDAAAFRLVDDHFDVLRAVVEECGGVCVKTMGDAMMAAFADPAQCARAAVLALLRFEQFRERARHGARVGIKLGGHAGTCYLVTANGTLDYFGQTVNIASRAQHLAGGGQIVVSRELFQALPDDVLPGVSVEYFEAQVKGVDAPLDLARVSLRHSRLPPPPPVSSRELANVDG